MQTSFSSQGRSEAPAPRRGARLLVNDIHSRLNPTPVDDIVRVDSVRALQRAVAAAASRGASVSICGGRHAMGGQQFGAGTVLLDTARMNRVVDFDVERGLITVEAGIDWTSLVNHLLWAGADHEHPWGIVQKQTGADRLSIGGALSANIHGRGLRMPPMIANVESFDLVDAAGALVHCSRSTNAELFTLAIGGYGLFGVIGNVTLRLAPRVPVERRVAIARVDDLPALFDERIADGFEYGDFQFATDPASGEFLHAGVFSCYRPVPGRAQASEAPRALTHADWRRLLLLAHTDKSRAFAEYARYYMGTDGQVYWSDTHQLSFYEDDYHESLDHELCAPTKGSEMITELYVPRHTLPAFMTALRGQARHSGMDIIYGTIRLIEQDAESFLAWARQPWACIVVNLHVEHSPAGVQKAADDFRRLIDTAIRFDGSYYLTYHRWATAAQALRCHPRLPAFLRLKKQYDPACVFTSEWYRHHSRLPFGFEE